MKKATVTLTVVVDIEMPDDASAEDVLSEMDYKFASQTDGAEITDTDITGWDVCISD